MRPMLLLIVLTVPLVARGPDTPQFKTYTFKEHGFSVSLPGKPNEKVDKVEATGAVNHAFTVDTGKFGYGVIVGPIGRAKPDDAVRVKPEAVEPLLDKLRDAWIGLYKGKLISEQKVRLAATFPGREFIAEGPFPERAHCRIYLVGPRCYIITVGGPKDEIPSVATDRFLDSFKARESD